MAAWLAARALHMPMVDPLPQSLGTLAVTVCLILVMWRWGWLRSAGVTVLGGGRLWLLTAGLTIFVVVAYQLAFSGEIVVDLSAAWKAGEVQTILLRQAVVGIVEETLFRGFLLFGLRNKMGELSILVQIVPFVLVHFGKLELETLSTLVTGLYFGYIAYRTDSYWPAFLIHLFINVVFIAMVNL